MAKTNSQTKLAARDDREITEDHSKWLHEAIGLSHDHQSPLPEKLVEKYWELKRIFDRGNGRVTQNEINFMCWLLGHGKPTGEEQRPPTVLEMYRKKQIKKGDKLEVLYRDKWMEGVLTDVTGNNELVVQPTGEADERRFSVDEVRVAAVAA